VRELLGATLAVLAGAIGALVDGAFGPAPDALAHAAVKLVFRGRAFAHEGSKFGRKRAFPRGCPLAEGAQYTHRPSPVKPRGFRWSAGQTRALMPMCRSRYF